MAWCLPKHLVNDFLKKLKSGEISPEKLIYKENGERLTSEERRAILAPIVGAENAHNINAQFESKLLLKNQVRGIINWAKQLGGLKEETKRDILSKATKMTEVLTPENENEFLEDLVSKKLGIDVTYEEAQNIAKLSKAVERARMNINNNSKKGDKSRLRYGMALMEFKNYIEALKLDADKLRFKDYLKNPLEILYTISGVMKSVSASLDNSFFGRQGIKVLLGGLEGKKIWAKNFLKSWKDIGKAIVSKNAMDAIKAEIYSRENAINGNYSRLGIDIGIDSEEAYPSSLPDRIPLIGRLFRASEVAFNGAAMRMRADLADSYIRMAEENGHDMTTKEEAKTLGKFINSQTGRGDIGGLGQYGREINLLFFSAKFLKSNIDTLLEGVKQGIKYPFMASEMTFAQKQAAKNLATIIANLATIMMIASWIDEDSVDLDPRSQTFGKLKFGDQTFDITGGLGSLTSLLSRITPTFHDGQLGFWKKTSKGEWVNLTEGKYGQENVFDVFVNFFANKAAPLSSDLIQLWKGKDYDGNKPTIKSLLLNHIQPISLQSYNRIVNSTGLPLPVAMFLEEIGLSSSVYNSNKSGLKKKSGLINKSGLVKKSGLIKKSGLTKK